MDNVKLEGQEFKFYAVGSVVEKSTELPSSGVRRTTLVLESNEPVGEGREPNRVQVFFYGPVGVEAADLNIGDTIAVEGRIGGRVKKDRADMERAFPYLSASKFEDVSAEDTQGFAFEARGKVARDPSFTETKGGTAHARVILERTYNSYLGPQSDQVELNAFRSEAMALAATTPGQEVYINGAVRSRTYETQDGQKRWTTDLFAREAIVLSQPQATAGAVGPKGPEGPAV